MKKINFKSRYFLAGFMLIIFAMMQFACSEDKSGKGPAQVTKVKGKTTNDNFSDVINIAKYSRSGFWGGGAWTNGDALIKNMNFAVSPNMHYMAVHTEGWRLRTSNEIAIAPAAEVNNKPAPFSHRNGNSLFFTLPRPIETINSIRLRSSTFVPKSIGLNEDERSLGIDVKDITLEP